MAEYGSTGIILRDYDIYVFLDFFIKQLPIYLHVLSNSKVLKPSRTASGNARQQLSEFNSLIFC